MARTASFYIDAALTAYNAGFTSKSGQQNAIADLNRAYDLGVKGMIQDELLQIDRAERDDQWNTLYWGTPDLHNWKPKHSELFARFTENVALAEQLVALRASIKAAPVNAPVRAEPSPYEVKARETLMDLIQRRQTQYLEAVALGEVFGGLPVSANTHLVTNEYGTTFLRTFYYLAGQFTPLVIIIAAAQELEDRAKAKA
jgi:hypothetical protein